MPCEPIDVFDFDGTLIGINSFTEIGRRLVQLLVQKKRLGTLAGVATRYAARRFGLLRHLTFKRYIVRVFERALTEREKEQICRTVFRENVNQTVYERMMQTADCIISTACPHAYISRMPLDSSVRVISSLMPGPGYPDPNNYGSGKIENIRHYFKGRNVKITNFFTDDMTADKPLAGLAEHVYIVTDGRVTQLK